jgi:Sulfotransferase domain
VALHVVGAGLGRTGTLSLKHALERLLGAPCYHMMEVFGRPGDIAVWQRALEGDEPDWQTFLSDYAATVDWPACAFWRELTDEFPDACVLLSVRDTDGWWDSADNTIFQVSKRPLPADEPMFAAQMTMVHTLFDRRFTPNWTDEAKAKAAYDAHNAEVRAAVPAARLVEWHPGDGWEPLCAALSVPVPAEPFPHLNTTADFRAMARLEKP